MLLNSPDSPVLDCLAGVSVLSLMAVDDEYGALLATRIRPVRIGVGPIEAAVNTMRTLAELRRRDTRPELVLSLGSAGSHTLAQTGVHRVTSVSWRDIDASPLGFEKGLTPFLDMPAVRTLPNLIPSLPGARLSTGAAVIGDADGYAQIDAELVDMETFAVLRACDAHGLPLIGIRAVSDGDVALQRYGDWADCLPLLDRGLAQAVDALVRSLGEGVLDRALSN